MICLLIQLKLKSIYWYVSKEKFDDVNQKYQSLQNDTKDFEDIKTKYESLVAKQEKDGQISLINKYVQPEYAEFVHYQMKQGNLLNDKLEDNVKEYLKKNTQYGLTKEKEQKPQPKIINTYVDTENGGGKKPETSNQAFNNLIRGALGKQVE